MTFMLPFVMIATYGEIMMYIGILKIKIKIHDAFTLKDKRRVKQSMIEKIRLKFKVSIAEVEDHEVINLVSLGIAGVSNSNRVIENILRSIEEFIEDNYETEIIESIKDIQVIN